jgi:alpha-L-rhamnosidase
MKLLRSFSRVLPALLLLSGFFVGVAPLPADPLEDLFKSPPQEAKPRVLWMWMGSNISTEGITRDLEALKTAGYGGATMFSLADTTTPWAGVIGGSPTAEIVAWTEPW